MLIILVSIFKQQQLGPTQMWIHLICSWFYALRQPTYNVIKCSKCNVARKHVWLLSYECLGRHQTDEKIITDKQYQKLIFRMWYSKVQCEIDSSAPDFTDRNSGEKGVNHFWDSYLLRKTPAYFGRSWLTSFWRCGGQKPLYIFGFAHH